MVNETRDVRSLLLIVDDESICFHLAKIEPKLELRSFMTGIVVAVMVVSEDWVWLFAGCWIDWCAVLE